MNAVKAGPRPFNEVLVEEIANQSDTACGSLGPVLLKSLIPANHDEIRDVVNRKWGHLQYWAALVDNIRVHLAEEKVRAAFKATEAQKATEEKVATEAKMSMLLDETELLLDEIRLLLVRNMPAGHLVQKISRLWSKLADLRENAGRPLSYNQ